MRRKKGLKGEHEAEKQRKAEERRKLAEQRDIERAERRKRYEERHSTEGLIKAFVERARAKHGDRYELFLNKGISWCNV